MGGGLGWMRPGALALALVGCGPDVTSAASGEGEGDADGTGESITLDDGWEVGSQSTGEDGEADGEAGDTCLGECGVECFEDPECGAGEVCDEYQCDPLAPIARCEGTASWRVQSQGIGPGAVVDGAIGDVDGNGAADVVIARVDPPQVVVFAGDGAGGFAEAAAVPVPEVPVGIASADMDGDEAAEIVIATATTVLVARGDAMGMLGEPTPIATAAGVIDIALGDGNLDGLLDLVVFDGSPALTPWHADGAGGFTQGTTTMLPRTVGTAWSVMGAPRQSFAVAVAGLGEVRVFSSAFTGVLDERNPGVVLDDAPVLGVGLRPQDSGVPITFGLAARDGWTVLAMEQDSTLHRRGTEDPWTRMLLSDVLWLADDDGAIAASLDPRDGCLEVLELPAAAVSLAAADLDGDGTEDLAAVAEDMLAVVLSGG
ncbi:MAG TPA: VCBS repeat-containing protein [Nannocystaceae bacterium]|nr:VCBS repeat-containing protein [Nannocystaceae bacterium]